MTEEQLIEMLHVVRGDIESAMASNAAYLKIHNLAASDQAIQAKLNHEPEFWRLFAHALQTTFFISLGRVFDTRRDAMTIFDLVDGVVGHVGFFSKSALRERKRASSAQHGDDPPWLEAYIAAAWEPDRKDLQDLRTALTPYGEKFTKIYQPIRHQNFAHRSKTAADEIHELFSKTRVGEATDILRFLYTLIWEIFSTTTAASRISRIQAGSTNMSSG